MPDFDLKVNDAVTAFCQEVADINDICVKPNSVTTRVEGSVAVVTIELQLDAYKYDEKAAVPRGYR